MSWRSIVDILDTIVSYFPIALLAYREVSLDNTSSFLDKWGIVLLAIAINRLLHDSLSSDKASPSIKDISISLLLLCMLFGSSSEIISIITLLTSATPIALRSPAHSDWRAELAVIVMILQGSIFLGCPIFLSISILLWAYFSAFAFDHLSIQEACFYFWAVGLMIYDVFTTDPHRFVETSSLDYNTLSGDFLSSIQDIYSPRAAMWVSEVAFLTLLTVFLGSHLLLRVMELYGAGTAVRMVAFQFVLLLVLANWAWPLLTSGLKADPFDWLMSLVMYHSGDPIYLAFIVAGWVAAIGAFSYAAARLSCRQPPLDRVSCRKIFHALVLVMFIPVHYYPPLRTFLTLSLGGAICLFTLVEFLRLRLLPDQLASFSDYFALFLVSADQKSWNKMLTSHLTLMVAIALPIISRPMMQKFGDHHHLEQLELLGLVTVGLGDAIAAVVGVRYGKTKWRDYCSKSVEGTSAAFISMAMLMIGLSGFDLNMMIVLALSSLSEVFFAGNDNLTMPMYAIVTTRLIYLLDPSHTST